MYSTDCNYVVKVIGNDSRVECYIECYTKEQLKK